MEPKIISVYEVYETIRRTYSQTNELPVLPDRRRDKNVYQPYKDKHEKLVSNVPDIPGVYLWFSKYGFETIDYIYVGESGTRNQGLQTRFKEEFKNWHHCFWATAFNSTKYLAEAIYIYVESGNYTPDKVYTNNICNDWLKRGATHLVYWPDLPKDKLKTVQDDLIQLFKNPRGNIAGRRKVPLPEDKLLQLSKDIFESFVECCKNAEPYIQM